MCRAISFISVGLSVVALGVLITYTNNYSYDRFKLCYLQECCHPYSRWVVQDLTDLRNDLEKNLIGQPLAKKIVQRYLSNHLRKDHPKKALVMSFQGGEGTGKKFTLDAIIRRLYLKGAESCFVKRWIGPLDFIDKNKLKEYIRDIKRTIEEVVSSCPRSMFIFHETNTPVPEVKEAFLPYMGYHENVNGIDFRKAIFVFISREGEKLIENWTHQLLVEQKRKRDEMTVKDFKLLSVELDDKEETVDVFVPFLPLTSSHVEMCIRSVLYRNNCQSDSKTITKILEELTFKTYSSIKDTSSNTLRRYAVDGCKSVEETVNMVLELPCDNIRPI